MTQDPFRKDETTRQQRPETCWLHHKQLAQQDPIDVGVSENVGYTPNEIAI